MSRSTFDPETREGEHATIVTHTAVVGSATRGEPVLFDEAIAARRFRIGQPTRFAQHPVSVGLRFMPLGKRDWTGYYRVVPDNITYYTIESAAGVLYDSRQDVPCDMEKFEATKRRFVAEWRKDGYEVFA